MAVIQLRLLLRSLPHNRRLSEKRNLFRQPASGHLQGLFPV
jgi:hypothetical protein